MSGEQGGGGAGRSMWRALAAGAALAVLAACGGASDQPTPSPPMPASVEATPRTTTPPADAATPTATTSPSPTPTPAATTSPSPTPTPTAAPSPSPTPATSPSPSPMPAPAATPSPSPTPVASPSPVAVTPLTAGEPRHLPPGIALFHRVFPCWQCGAGHRDFRRTVFDADTGQYREDRPLAFFDGVNPASPTDQHPVRSFRVGASGRAMAVAVCHAGLCDPLDPLMGGGFPTADADLRVWVSRDAGRTWTDRGPVLPGSSVVEVTDDDVLILEESAWLDWGGMSEEEWARTLTRLAPPGPDDPEEWAYRFRWLRSGETFALPAAGTEETRPPWYRYWGWRDGRPVLARGFAARALALWAAVPELPAPTLDGLHWESAGVRPDGLPAWDAMAEGEYRLAISDESGNVRDVYGSAALGELPVSMALGGRPVNAGRAFATNDLFILGFATDSGFAAIVLLDLASLTFHPVPDLVYPAGDDADGDGRNDGYYQFIAARPHPADEPR